jgi:hypothetical protein
MANYEQGLATQGILFVGDKGKIIAGFMGQDPQLLTPAGRRPLWQAMGVEKPAEPQSAGPNWLPAMRGATQTQGNFASSAAITDTTNLGAVALQARNLVKFDSATMKITNLASANRFLYREYRDGWKLG